MNFTSDQERAIHTLDRNVIVVAGAGSGKTSVLVNRYLALLDAHPDWELNALVAITFTQKAAREMRDRVRQALEQRLARATSEDEIERWSARVAAMDGARIDTIHALCSSLLRANAAEAGVDPEFAVVEDIDAHILLDNAIDDSLQAIVTDGDPAVALFAEYSARAVRETLSDFAEIALGDLPDDPFVVWQSRWHDAAQVAVQMLLDDADFREHCLWIAPDQLPPNDKLADVWRAALDQAAVLYAEESELDARLVALWEFKSVIKLNVGAASAWGGKDGLAEAKEVLRALRTRAEEVLSVIGEPPGDLDRRAAASLPLWASLVRRVQAAYRDAKAAGAQLDFADLEARTRHLLDTPTVRARYQGAEFKHVLVDEFQDTNAAQWDIIRALADPATPGSLFVVGDARQSIYAFRGADVSVFEQVRVQLSGLGVEIGLSRSFRTHRHLVDGFNALFAQVLVRGASSPTRAYEIELGVPMDAARDLAPTDDAPVEFMLVEKVDDGEEKRDAEDYRRAEASALAERIRALVEDEGRLIHDKRADVSRPVSYGDVAILFQALSNVTLYEDALKAAGVPYVTVAGRGYYDRQEVWDLIHLLQALYNLSDDLSLAAVLRSPLFSLSDDALLALRRMADSVGPDERLYAGLEAAAAELENGAAVPGVAADEVGLVAFAYEQVSELHRLAGRVTIAELLREALARTGYLAALTGMPDGARRRGNVEKLLDKAQSSGKTTLGAFSQYLADLSAYEAREGEAIVDATGAVTLMSVHKSKGLEFPVVVLADTSRDRAGGDSGLLLNDPLYGLTCKVFDVASNKIAAPSSFAAAEALRKRREEAERRRLLYVAATRAEDLLIVSGQVERDRKFGELKARGWLGWMLDAYNLHDVEPGGALQVEQPWGDLRVKLAAADQMESSPQPRREPDDVWEQWPFQPGEPTSEAVSDAPPLLRPPQVSRDGPTRSLTSSNLEQLGALGGVSSDPRARRQLRRELLYDAPPVIETVNAAYRPVSPRKVGQIVHQALRWWRFPTPDDDLTGLLASYAWGLGIVDARDQDEAARRAAALLRQVAQSELYQWIENASQVYRDVPFVYRAGDRTVQGSLDVLFARHDDSWALVEYKSDIVGSGDAAALAEDARRFHLQVGLYATAAADQLAALFGRPIVPDVFIHYIRHGATLAVPTGEWQSALASLDDRIDDLMGMGKRP